MLARMKAPITSGTRNFAVFFIEKMLHFKRISSNYTLYTA